LETFVVFLLGKPRSARGRYNGISVVGPFGTGDDERLRDLVPARDAIRLSGIVLEVGVDVLECKTM